MDVSGNGPQLLPCEEERLFPVDQACWVFINYIDEDGLWVMLESEEPIMTVISDALNATDSGERVLNPTVNNVVSALNTDKTWYRAIIEAVEPDIKVRFIDFGDTLVVPKENLAPLPSTLSIQRRLAMKVHLPPDSTLKPSVSLKMLVKSVSSRIGSVVVEVLQSEEEAMIHDSIECPKENSIVCSSSQQSDSGALTCSASEFSASHIESCSTDNEPVESISLAVLDVPPPTGFSSDVFPVPDPEENDVKVEGRSAQNIFETSPHSLTIHSQVLEVAGTPIDPSANPLGSPRGISIESEINESAVSSLEQLSCSSDGDRVLNNSDSDKEPLPSETTKDFLEIQNLSAENLVEDAVSSAFPKAVTADQLTSVTSGDISTSTSDEKIVVSEDKSQSSSSNMSKSVNLNATNAVASKKHHCVRNGSEDGANYSFTSALEQYPNVGGGYAALSAGSEHKQDPQRSSLNSKQSSSTPRIITKGRSNESCDLVHKQDTRPPPSSYSPARSYGDTSKVSSQKSCAHSFPQDIKPDDFKAVLEFELSIIREQNRLQILQVQKKMEQNTKNQIKAFKDEVAKQLVMLQNEVYSKLAVINDSVVHKMADIYSDLTLLKNDQEMNVHKRPRPGCDALASQDRSRSMREILPGVSSCDQDFHESTQHGMHDLRSSGNSQADRDIRNSHFHGNFRSQHQGQFSNEFNKRDLNSIDDMKAPPNHLMDLRKEKIKEAHKGQDYSHSHKHNENSRAMERGSNQNYHRETTMYQSLDKHLDEQHSSFPVGQFNPNCLEMDSFKPSETTQETNTDPGGNKGGSGCIISVSNLNAEKINPDLLFNLFGVYGNVQKIKMSQQDKGRAFIEMENSSQAQEALKHLSRAPLMGQRLYVTPCSFGKLIFSRQDIEANTCKDFTKQQMMTRYPNRFRSFKWDPLKLFAPSSRLMITNVLKSVSDEKVKELFAKNGFQLQHIFSHPCGNDEKKIIFANLGSIEEAVNALTVMHLQETSDWSKMRISFARNDKVAF